jgi:hypothetical protein
MELMLALLTTAVAVALLLVVMIRDQSRLSRTWQRHRLDFGRDVTRHTVPAILDHLSGLPRGRSVLLEVLSEPSRISHFLETDRATFDSLEGGLRALLPGLRLQQVELAERRPRRIREIRISSSPGNLRIDATEEAAAALLGAMAPPAEGESIRLRWQLAGARSRPSQATRGRGGFDFERYRLSRAKNEGRSLRVRGTLESEAGSLALARDLTEKVEAVLRTRSTAHGELRFTTVPRAIGNLLDRFPSGSRFNSAELSGLIGWPIGSPALPGLLLGTSPTLMPSDRIPATGRIIGDSTWPGRKRQIAQPVLGALSHTLVAGPTGVGKSTLLINLITADMNAGRAVVLIDGKGDTAAGVLARVPERRIRDVIVIDCANDGPQPGLRLLRGEDSELAADVVLGVLADLFKDHWGPLSERYLRAGLVAVAHDPEGTLADLPFVFSDAPYRRRLIARLSDPLSKATFAAYEAMGPAARQQQIAAPLNRLGALLGRPVVRTVLGQSDPSLDFSRALAGRQIVVISLAPSRVGGPASRLIGALSLFALFQSVQDRSGLPASAREPAFAYVDEPRALGDMPMPLDSMLEQARGLGVGVCIAPQSVGRLGADVRSTVLTNAATRIVFRQNAEDARVLARDFREVSADDLAELSAWEAVVRIGLGPGDIAPAVTVATRPALPAIRDGEALARDSAARWGRTIDQVDTGLRERHSRPRATDSAIGRRKKPR